MERGLPLVQVPSRTDADGVIQVSGTRVTLDAVVGAFGAGASAEEITQQYPSVALPDVYLIIAYCLRNTAEVRRDLAQRQLQAARVERANERRFDPSGVRDRLLARRA